MCVYTYAYVYIVWVRVNPTHLHNKPQVQKIDIR